jgi:ABC-type branched-subunit amino acid transport system ATPase component
MLKQIRLIDFKSFADEQVELAPLTLLVGANASGKSNFLDAVWFLHGLALGSGIGEILADPEDLVHRNGEHWPGLRGGSKEASRLGTAQFEIQTTWEDPLNEAETDIQHQIVCQTLPSLLIRDESCGPVDGPLRNLVSDGHVSGVNRPRVSPIVSDPDPAATLLAVAGGCLGDIHQIAIRPEQMRGYGKLKRPHLAADGTNFSGALHSLCVEPEEQETLVDWLTELLAPEIIDIDFIKVEELGDVMAVFVEKDGTRVSARSLSDGTLRFLGLLLSLRQADHGSTFLIEEIDSGLHPARIRVLMELLRQVTRERGLQIIATTHDPACLEYLDDEALRGVIVFGRVPEHQGTIMRRLGDLPHFNDVVKRQGISELFTTGWLEMAL